MLNLHYSNNINNKASKKEIEKQHDVKNQNIVIEKEKKNNNSKDVKKLTKIETYKENIFYINSDGEYSMISEEEEVEEIED